MEVKREDFHPEEHERIDDLQNGYYIIQDDRAFCFGADAVLLSDFARVRQEDTVVDFCTGSGIVPILLAAKTDSNKIHGLEIQERGVLLGKRSIMYNHLEDRVTITKGDVKKAFEIYGKEAVQVVTCNPPYMKAQQGLKNEKEEVMIARHEILLSLDELLESAAKILINKGRFYMVHRPSRLAEIMTAMTKHKIEPKRMRLVYPFIDKEPNMVLIEGLKNGNPQLNIERPLIMYKSPGVYEDEIYDIYGKEKPKEEDKSQI